MRRLIWELKPSSYIPEPMPTPYLSFAKTNSRGSHREAHGNLSAPRATAREEQIRHVGACNQQHKSDRTQQDQEERAHPRADHGLVWPETHDELLPHNVGISASEIPCDDVHLRLELLARHTGF